MVRRILIGIVLVWAALVVFMPKEALYFKLERELVKQGVELNEASIEEGPASLTLHDVSVYVKGIEVAQIKEVHLFTLLFYNRLTVEEVTVDEGLRSMMPAGADRIVLQYTPLSPLRLSIEAEGAFGKAVGYFAFKERLLHLDLTKTGTLGVLRGQMKQGEKGWYYEKTF